MLNKYWVKYSSCLKRNLLKNFSCERDYFQTYWVETASKDHEFKVRISSRFQWLWIKSIKPISLLRWTQVNTLVTVNQFSFVRNRDLRLLVLPLSPHKPDYRALMELHHISLQSKLFSLRNATTQTWSQVKWGSSQWEKFFSSFV